MVEISTSPERRTIARKFNGRDDLIRIRALQRQYRSYFSFRFCFRIPWVYRWWVSLCDMWTQASNIFCSKRYLCWIASAFLKQHESVAIWFQPGARHMVSVRSMIQDICDHLSVFLKKIHFLKLTVSVMVSHSSWDIYWNYKLPCNYKSRCNHHLEQHM